MSAFSAAQLLRPGVLEGVTIMLARSQTSTLGDALGEGVAPLSASLRECPLPADEEAFALRLREEGAPDLLVVDAAGVSGSSDAPGREEMSSTLQVTWEVTRTVAGALIEQQRPGRIALVAPAADAGLPDQQSFARATRAGLENLARTTSIEWARYGITPVAIMPGPDTPKESLAALCAYLASPAGSYFSGCVLALDGLAAADPAGEPA